MRVIPRPLKRVHLLAATLTLVFAGVFTGSVLAAPQARHMRPGHARVSHPQASGHAMSAHPVTAFAQEFQTNTSGFCNGGPSATKCDGGVGDYGTIDRVHSRFSNGGSGNYAPFTKALVGSYMALTSGSQMPNERQSCPQTSTEYCSGPYALFTSGSAVGQDNVFPSNGFTVTDDLYLSPSTATTGQLVDDDVELNNNAGMYGRDNVITACPQSGSYVINFGNSSPGSCTGSPVISADGWYRFVFIFSDVGGDAYVTEKVIQEQNGSVVASSGRQPELFPTSTGPTPISQWGGPGYFWLPTEDVSGMPLANFALQLGQVAKGHKP